MARALGDRRLADQSSAAPAVGQRVRPGDRPAARLEFYEGGKWNYSFRLLHDMAARGSSWPAATSAFVGMLDRFFGYGAEPVTQPGVRPARPRWPPATR